MHAEAPLPDAPSPSTGADIGLVVGLLGVIVGLSWGVIWEAGALAAESPDQRTWLGAVPPLAAAASGALLLLVRRAYPTLPRLRTFVARVAWLGVLGAAVLAVLFALAMD